MNSTAQASNAPPRAPLAFLGLACAVGVSTIYYNQPLLLDMAHSYGSSHAQIGLVAMATQVGYALGMVFFVPLGDVLERRALMMKMYAAVAAALLLVAASPSLNWLIAASVLMGMLAAVTHIALPIAPDLVDDAQRGRAIGTVMTGLLLGVLLARTFSGWASKIHGWRYVFVIAAVINLAFVPLLRRKMPLLPPKHALGYGEALRSLWTLLRTKPLLREASVMGGLLFASFSCFWTTLVLMLGSHYGLGAGVAGTFGVVGAAGALVAPVAGRLADRHGSRWVLHLGGATLTASFVLMGAEEWLTMPMPLHMAALVVGVILLDVGMQMSQVANQTRIFGLAPNARSRVNTVYMTAYFTGGALGSGLSAIAWAHWGWNGVCAVALGFVALAGLRQATGQREDDSATGSSPTGSSPTGRSQDERILEM